MRFFLSLALPAFSFRLSAFKAASARTAVSAVSYCLPAFAVALSLATADVDVAAPDAAKATVGRAQALAVDRPDISGAMSFFMVTFLFLNCP